MDERVTTVSITANRSYIRALSALARNRGVRIGDVVREAVDAQHGDTLQRYIEFFAAEDVAPTQQVDGERVG